MLNVLIVAVPLFLVGAAHAATDTNFPTVILVVGASGEEEFGTNFIHQAQLWEKTCSRAIAKTLKIGLEAPGEPNDHDRLQQALTAEPLEGTGALWLVLVGHGTFDGKEARFNLRGPDVSATELAGWLKPFRRPVVVINTASSSAPFLAKLSATNRVIISATRSGHEQNYARFGSYLAEAISDPQSDLDKDSQVSLLEAFLSAAHRVAEFYKTEGRLMTEHALIDDTGDGLGTPADWFRGVRAAKKPQQGASLDGARAHQLHLVLSPEEQELPPDVRAKRDALELAIVHLRENKTGRPEADYYQELERLLLEMARLMESPSSSNSPAPNVPAAR